MLIGERRGGRMSVGFRLRLCGVRGATVVLAMVVLFQIPAAAGASNLIADPGFESGSLTIGPQFGAIPPSVGFWTARDNPPQPPRLVGPPMPVHAGSWAAEIDTRTATHGEILIQDFATTFASYVWVFWVYPAEGYNAAEILYNWDRGVTGSGVITTRMDYGPADLIFRAWDTTASFPPLPTGGGHEVKVVANTCSLVQDLYVDGLLVGSVRATSGGAPAGMATVVFGDTGNIAKHGLFYYDDESFEEFDCAVPTPCPLSHGFWKNHANDWPTDSLTLGGETYGTDDLLRLLRMPTRADASLILARQLIAAKLTVANGSDPAPVATTIADADDALGAFAGRLPYRVRPSSSEGQGMVALAAILDEYNNGHLTPGCEDEHKDVSPSAMPKVWTDSPGPRPGDRLAGVRVRA
jgi:hypothetical protein